MVRTGVVATRNWSIPDLEVRKYPGTGGPESSHVVVCMFGLDVDVFVGTKEECEDFVSKEQEEYLRTSKKVST